jgi:hypothetical protein
MELSVDFMTVSSAFEQLFILYRVRNLSSFEIFQIEFALMFM